MKLEDLVNELREDYLKALTEKVPLLETLLARRAFRDLETEYHKMKGNGVTSGLPEVTELGASVESLFGHRSIIDIRTAANGALVSEDDLVKAVSLSIGILKRVLSERSSGRALNLAQDAEFAQIRALTAVS